MKGIGGDGSTFFYSHSKSISFLGNDQVHGDEMYEILREEEESMGAALRDDDELGPSPHGECILASVHHPSFSPHYLLPPRTLAGHAG